MITRLRSSDQPDRLYGAGSNYQFQRLKLGKQFADIDENLRRVRERGGELEIASPKPAVRKILQVTGLDSVFTLVDDANRSRPKPAVPQ